MKWYNPEREWLNPNDFYDTDYLLGEGNQNKLDADHIDRLINMGKEGLIEYILESDSPIIHQYFKGKLIANNGNHRIYAARELSIINLPSHEDLYPIDFSSFSKKIIHVADWEVLSHDEYEAHLKALDDLC